jgi:ArsR family transcriptional regulator
VGEGTRLVATVPEIEEFEASALRTLASAHRLRLIQLLGHGPCEVHELADGLDLSQATTSQHLAALRSAGFVESVRDGRSVRYRLTDPDTLTACSLIRDVLVRRLARLGRLAAAAGVPRAGKPADVVADIGRREEGRIALT